MQYYDILQIQYHQPTISLKKCGEREIVISMNNAIDTVLATSYTYIFRVRHTMYSLIMSFNQYASDFAG